MAEDCAAYKNSATCPGAAACDRNRHFQQWVKDQLAASHTTIDYSKYKYVKEQNTFTCEINSTGNTKKEYPI